MYLGLKLLPSQLAMMGLNEKDSIVSRFRFGYFSLFLSKYIFFARFEDGFKQMWVANGNSLSKIYAGTGALCR